MQHGKFSHASLFLCLLLPLLASGCAGQIEDGEEQQQSESQQTSLFRQPVWKHCANQGGSCSFTGTGQVRFGAGSRFTILFAYNKILCDNSAFKVDYGTGNHCELLSEGAPLDAGTPVHNHDGGTMAALPYVNRAAIPRGDPGVSQVEIRSTSEQPAPDGQIGAFRTSCMFSHMNFDDAIVYPGQPGVAHLHAYFGNTLANASSTASSLRSSGNSTCRGGIANRTAYWVPALLDRAGNPVRPMDAQFYYKTGYDGIAPAEVRPFPGGLRMIAGDAKSKATQSRAYWGCSPGYIGHPGSIPQCQAGDTLVMTVQFPQCWDGRNVDSSDHKSHMSYPVGGNCPSTHPVAIPEITFNIYYAVGNTSTAGWRLASDMYDASLPGGYSAHGDYFEAWDPEIVKAFVKNCENAAADCHSHLLGDGRMLFNSHER